MPSIIQELVKPRIRKWQNEFQANVKQNHGLQWFVIIICYLKSTQERYWRFMNKVLMKCNTYKTFDLFMPGLIVNIIIEWAFQSCPPSNLEGRNKLFQ